MVFDPAEKLFWPKLKKKYSVAKVKHTSLINGSFMV
jgi:hypothetical protein